MSPPNGQDKLVLMLSSGERPRYRDDIIRVMALPTGGRLQFRYRKKYVPDDVFCHLPDNGLSDCKALIAYLDTSNQDRPPEIVPCRFAQVLDSELEGEFAVIRFEVGDFAVTDQGVNPGSEASKLMPQQASLPHWENGSLKGHFLVALTRRLSGWQSLKDRRAWQAVVGNLGARKDFRDCPFFYHLRTVIEEDANTAVPLCEGKYVLKPDKIYRADVVHYTASTATGQQGGPWGRLEASAQGNGVQSLTTQHLAIDSPYDIKRVYFRTSGEASKQYALLSFGRRVTQPSGDQETEHHDFELVLEVKGTWGRAMLIAVLIGLSLALPRWIEIFHAGPWVNAVAHSLGALVAGSLVVFGLRKVP